VPDVDPQTAAVILRCLEQDPRARPASVMEVAASLPGGSPLAAALAAGETPSPEMVVAAPMVGSLRPWVAATYVAGVVLGLAAIFALVGEVRVLSQVPFERPPEVLMDRARNVLASLGHGEEPLDVASGFGVFEDYGRFLRESGSTPGAVRERLAGGRPPLIYFWYRQSPRNMVPASLEVRPEDPPRSTPGEAYVILDPEGRLQHLEVVPSPGSGAGWARPGDWSALLAAADLATEDLSPAAPQAIPPVYADSRVAWTGNAPGSGPPIPLRIEAASYGGAAVFFDVGGPWAGPGRTGPPPIRRLGEGVGAFLTLNNIFFVSIVLAGAFLTRRNLRLGRGDRRGARRLAWFIAVVTLLGWILGGSHAPGWAERDLAFAAVGMALAKAGLLWLAYIGLEPYLRRDFPARIIAWSRLLAGNFRDPLVGRDLLIGCLLGIGVSLSYDLRELAADRLGKVSSFEVPTLQALSGFSGLVSQLSEGLFSSVLIPLSFMVLFLLLRVLLRREALAVAALWVLFTALLATRGLGPPALFGLAFAGLTAAIYVFFWTRFGLLAGTAGHLVLQLTHYMPLTSDFAAWHSWLTVFVVLTVVSLALYGFSTSVAGQPLLRGVLLED
jgi:serine/threonine-protein kinase